MNNMEMRRILRMVKDKDVDVEPDVGRYP
jgi:hypothetical protein